MKLSERLKNSWSAFMGRDPTDVGGFYGGHRPNRDRYMFVNARSIVTTIYNQIAIDAAAIDIRHVRINENGQYEETIDDSLNKCLSLSANLDQTGRELIKDAILSMFDEGSVAIVPVLTSSNPNYSEEFNIYELRVGKIMDWSPKHVRVRLFEESTQTHREIVVQKSYTVILENPFYQIMNEPNSTIQLLKKTIHQMETINHQIGSGKLDLLIRLPYLTGSDLKQKRAAKRVQSLEEQLTGKQLGIGYIDASEQVIQLNRSLENNLWNQVVDLQIQAYNQLGMSQKIFDGTASESEQLNYYNRTIDPILTCITEEMKRKWLTRTAITQRQSIKYFRDPFKLVPVNSIAEIADKFTRNEIMTSNEIRSVIGIRPSKDPKADMLLNSNLNHPEEEDKKTLSGGSTINVENE